MIRIDSVLNDITTRSVELSLGGTSVVALNNSSTTALEPQSPEIIKKLFPGISVLVLSNNGSLLSTCINAAYLASNEYYTPITAITACVTDNGVVMNPDLSVLGTSSHDLIYGDDEGLVGFESKGLFTFDEFENVFLGGKKEASRLREQLRNQMQL